VKIFHFMPSDFYNDSQSFQENLPSRSEILFVGRPLSFQTSRKNLSTTCFPVQFLFQVIQSAIFVNWSTITRIRVGSCDSGTSVMKSVEMEVHALKGIFSGCSDLYHLCLGHLLCGHSSQDLT